MNTSQKDPFFDVPRTMASTSAGEFQLPALYYDVSCVTTMFRVDYDRAANKLAEVGLKPGLRWGKKAIVGLAFYEYRATSIGPYNEVGLAMSALPGHMRPPASGWLDLYSDPETRRVGFYILDLPVTTEIAWAGGRELWGFPKFVTQIPFELSSGSFSGQVLEPDSQNPIMTLEGQLGVGIPAPPMSLVLYSFLNGKALRAVVNIRGTVKLRGKGCLRLRVGGSDHVMAQNLRELGMDGMQPLLVMDTHRFQSRLNLGEEVKSPTPGA